MKDKKLFIISLGGSIIVPAPGEINILFLRRFKRLILIFLKKGYKFIIVAGGGKICRVYQKAASKIVKVPYEDLDWLGIHTTRLNAHLLRTIFRKEACPIVLDNPFKNIDISRYRVVVASGWRPGCSTDLDAVLLAKRFDVEEIINLSNISFVYDCDVNRYKNAKPFKNMSWSDYLRLFGGRWIPGLSRPFDPIAAKLAKKLNKKVIVVKGVNLKNLENLLKGKKFKGTTISN